MREEQGCGAHGLLCSALPCVGSAAVHAVTQLTQAQLHTVFTTYHPVTWVVPNCLHFLFAAG